MDKSREAGLMPRVRALVSTLDLDCECRKRLDTALQRFEALENRREIRRLLLDARQQADRISALLDFAGELDTLTTEEQDITVFDEIALLFKEMKNAAACGAEDMARIREHRAMREGSASQR
ncbi:hypothetical protein [Microvirga massiliensis]|uniref:hypothetical protein n=1 Tax=Microvirga massiliensis TaxID=1033741 RepID=UPI00062B5746|nr:hypothetical protein [Microvirga massiliensis]